MSTKHAGVHRWVDARAVRDDAINISTLPLTLNLSLKDEPLQQQTSLATLLNVISGESMQLESLSGYFLYGCD